MNIEEIKNKYKFLDINDGGLGDEYREGVDVVERNNVACIIKHPTEDKYLLAFWKKVDWVGFLTGGIDNGETLEDTARKEVIEESGYKNIKSITDLHFASHGLFYHVVKNQNRLAHYNLVLVELADLTQDEVSEEEKEICDFIWIAKDEVMGKLKRNDMKFLWEFYVSL